MILKHDITIKDDKTVIAISGQLDHDNIMHLEGVITKAVKDFGLKAVCIDLLQADYLPSICFGTLIGAAENLKPEGVDLEVVLSKHNAELAKSIGVARVMTVSQG